MGLVEGAEMWWDMRDGFVQLDFKGDVRVQYMHVQKTQHLGGARRSSPGL